MAPATGTPTARLVTGQHIHQVALQNSAYHAVERVLPQARSSVTAAPVPQVARPLPPIPKPVVRNTHLVPGTNPASTVCLVTARPARENSSQAPASSIVEKNYLNQERLAPPLLLPLTFVKQLALFHHDPSLDRTRRERSLRSGVNSLEYLRYPSFIQLECPSQPLARHAQLQPNLKRKYGSNSAMR
ncbi:hypothetical protein M422DRAFT_70574 [Sphaerobolus stellatus SS14]|uniref:Uncharacterized protein n=1 Tax=Sphaerobolus stellatus (strain SS14) TaxID=990650 RepID=A0A0C9UT69_SPHS4|nr:hypothetical protein M422DRAFT_70574 [Sphaerobolus stellatus SS14]